VKVRESPKNLKRPPGIITYPGVKGVTGIVGFLQKKTFTYRGKTERKKERVREWERDHAAKVINSTQKPGRCRGAGPT